MRKSKIQLRENGRTAILKIPGKRQSHRSQRNGGGQQQMTGGGQRDGAFVAWLGGIVVPRQVPRGINGEKDN